jgi:hypothetical protein
MRTTGRAPEPCNRTSVFQYLLPERCYCAGLGWLESFCLTRRNHAMSFLGQGPQVFVAVLHDPPA